MARNILFITTDQQRYDALGCNGGGVARTPVVDTLAAAGVRFTRAHCANGVCMPARTTMFTGMEPLTHGVVANGIPWSSGEKGIASWLKRQAGYRAALIGKAHFEPMLDLGLKYRQNRLAVENSTGPWLGFDHVELAMHGPMSASHYTKFLMENAPELAKGFALGIAGEGGGDTGAPEVKFNPVPREFYHTDWVADRTIAYIDTLKPADKWFIWMSFPDPHEPFDPPQSELHRVNWRDLDLPPGHPGSPEKIKSILGQKPMHWLDYYMGRYHNPEGGPQTFNPQKFTHDQVCEINAFIHVKNELIDEATGRVLARLAQRGQLDDTDIFFTTDHGDLQGDFGLMFKGPYHVDALLRIPFIYRPAKSAKIKPAVIDTPVGQADLFPTFCKIAGVPVPEWVQGMELPTSKKNARRERVITTWDSQYACVGMHMRTMHRDGYTITAYLPTTRDKGGRFPLLEFARGKMGKIPKYNGTEGELYNHKQDPHQWQNLWNDTKYKTLKTGLLADMYDNMPEEHTPPRKVVTPV